MTDFPRGQTLIVNGTTVTFLPDDTIFDEVFKSSVNFGAPLRVDGGRLNNITGHFQVIELAWAVLERIQLRIRPCGVCHVDPMRLRPQGII